VRCDRSIKLINKIRCAIIDLRFCSLSPSLSLSLSLSLFLALSLCILFCISLLKARSCGRSIGSSNEDARSYKCRAGLASATILSSSSSDSLSLSNCKKKNRNKKHRLSFTRSACFSRLRLNRFADDVPRSIDRSRLPPSGLRDFTFLARVRTGEGRGRRRGSPIAKARDSPGDAIAAHLSFSVSVIWRSLAR